MSAVAFRSRGHEGIWRGRWITDALFDQILPEAIYDRPIPERHRLIFYVGHLEAFDWNLIGRSALGLGAVSGELDRLFAFGIDPPSGRLPNDHAQDWPTLEQTQDYVTKVRERLDHEIEAAPREELEMALEHRLMHAETMTYLLHHLPYSRRRLTERRWNGQSGPSPVRKMVVVPAAEASLGRRRGEGFGWDNEFEQHRRDVPAFSVSKHKITNGQYLDLVRNGAPMPPFWFERHGEYYYRGFHAEVPLPLDFPVYVSHTQAELYARSIGLALPTEAQFHRAAFGTPDGRERTHPWGASWPGPWHGNFDFYHTDLVPVTETPAGDSAFGVSQMVGNGWEWTSDLFRPFDGFIPDASYPGYSANFFDGDHYVLKGGSCVTDALMLRSSFRNWFRRDYPYAYTTFRVVEN